MGHRVPLTDPWMLVMCPGPRLTQVASPVLALKSLDSDIDSEIKSFKASVLNINSGGYCGVRCLFIKLYLW